MPKKFKGENTKSSDARVRKAAAQHEKDEQRKQAVEDAYWEDDDKQTAKKSQRKDDKEQKRNDKLDRKKLLTEMHDEEMDSLKGKTHAPPPTKVTRAQIDAHAAEAAAEATTQKKATEKEKPIEVNVNRMVVEGDEARNVEDAISVLSVKDKELEKHPEKRMKAAFTQYEEENLPLLKKENPNLRLSQLKQMLKKDWMKSPQNPLNQAHALFNAPK